MTALQKQTVPLSLGIGVDSKTDPKQVVPGKLITLENAIFSSPKKLKKRNGYFTLATTTLAGASVLDAPLALTAYQQGLLLATRTQLLSWDVANSSWSVQGSLRNTPSLTTAKIAVNAQYNIQGYDLAIHSGGLQCAVYELYDNNAVATAGAYYTITDRNTGQVVLPPTRLTATGGCPKVLNIGSSFLITFIEAAQLYSITVNVATPLSASAAVAYTSGSTTLTLNTTTSLQLYDICTGAVSGTSYVWVVFNNNDGATRGYTVLECLASAPQAITHSKVVASTPSTAICIFPDYFNGPVVGYAQGTRADFAAYPVGLGAALGTGNLFISGGPVLASIAGVATGTGAAVWAYTVSDFANYQNDYVRWNSVTAYAANASAVLRRSVSLAGKPVIDAVGSGRALIPVVFDNSVVYAVSKSGPQSTFYVIDTAGNLIAQYATGTASGRYLNKNGALLYKMLPESPGPLSALGVPTGAITYPFGAAYSGIITGGISVLQVALYSATLTITLATAPTYLARAELAGTMLLGGAMLYSYDGCGAPVEHGFSFYPWVQSNAVTAAGGSITAGTRQYMITYEWTDGNGATYRSTPSTAFSVTNVLNDKNTLTIPTQRLTQRTGVRGEIQVVVYRTAAAGTIFYRVGYVANDTTVDTVTYADSATDASIIGNSQIYTTGSILADATPPATQAMCVHRNRVFLLDSTNRLGIWYSKPAVPSTVVGSGGSPVEFAGLQQLLIDPKGGDCTAIASLDDKLIVFKQDRIFAILGQGPGTDGSSNDFSDPLLVSSDTGALSQRSIALTADGIIFQSPKGIYQLRRDLVLEYIGAEVDGVLGSALVTSAIAYGAVNQIRLTLNNTTALVYDTLVKQWSVFTNIDATDATLWQGNYCYSKYDISGSPTGRVNQETTDATLGDNNVFIPMRVVTSWLSMAGLQGFQRLYSILVLGDRQSTCTLSFSIAYDFAASTSQTQTVTPATSGTSQWRFQPAQQKCEAFQLTISDAVSGAVGEGMSLSSIMLEVGIKRGAYKLPASQSTG